MRKLREVPGVKQAIVASGIRYDLLLADRKRGIPYLREIVRHHISGQMKIAPEHSEDRVLRCMGKPGTKSLLAFRDLFRKLTTEAGKEQFLSCYLIAAHPGCTQADMESLRSFAKRELAVHPEQVQLFTPVPSTISTLMYCSGRDPSSGKGLFVEKNAAGRELQKKILIVKNSRFMYGNSGHEPIKREGKSLVKTRKSIMSQKRSLPKHSRRRRRLSG
jgi:uncharacterized radical SAM protein YgiQ